MKKGISKTKELTEVKSDLEYYSVEFFENKFLEFEQKTRYIFFKQYTDSLLSEMFKLSDAERVAILRNLVTAFENVKDKGRGEN